MARGKLIDKCRNLLYHSNDKRYVRKRKNNESNCTEAKKVYLTEGITILKNNIKIATYDKTFFTYNYIPGK